MNKIISANINGFVFQIDELAYTKLKAYLDMIKQKVGNTEVAQDIENRIAELFSERLKNGSTAIFDQDVDEVMQQIGNPEQFGAEEQEEKTDGSYSSTAHQEQLKRRLYRDADDKVIGGVCSGIATYFGLDPVIIRLAFAGALFFFGSGVVLYILFMIVLPKAETPAQKLEMRGEPIDYKNVSKTVEKEFKDAFSKYKPEVKTGLERFIEIAVKVGMLALLIFLVSLLIPGCFALITGIGVASWTLPALSAFLFTSTTESYLILLGLLLFTIVPLFGVLYAILRILFKIKPLHKAISIGLSLVWFAGFCILAYSTYNIGKQFSNVNKVLEIDTLATPATQTNLIVKVDNSDLAFVVENTVKIEGIKMSIKYKNEDGDENDINSPEELHEFLDRKVGENVHLRIVQGFTDKPVLKIQKQSRGLDKRNAFMNAEQIEYTYTFKDSVLNLSPIFSLKTDQLWRNQKVIMTLEVPRNYNLLLDPSCENILETNEHFDMEFGKYLHIDQLQKGEGEE
jgi:phage shock protein PspC (stress-responsive transcriptional regulator)